ncbi:MAG: DUF63 family protein [Methanosarcinales archaeon]
MFEAVKEFIYKYYISGIIHDTSYNIVDTVSYALILGISTFAVLKLLRQLKVDVSRDLIRATVPYILAGSTLRVIEDTEALLPPWKYILITPPIYILIFIITVLLLVLSIQIGSILKRDWHQIFASIGIIWFVINLTLLLRVKMPERVGIPLLIMALGTTTTLSVYLAARKINFECLTDRLNTGILGAHLIDASSTFVGVDLLGYYEKHVVPTLLIDLTGTAAVMYPLKLAIFIPAIYLLDEEVGGKDDQRTQNLINLIKLVILVLGLSPAVRNTLRMTLGV